ncbi:unnamed protein product [Didymodactylos carnosus]|uniref:Phosphate transporter n=1 Tax=Didymodactylos carnosus TaxID=1234261 RepID=A0A813Y731_9BILA|nr:unnamed protein product [Didymodactylos carnosus]CAF0882648.1 unnamed protein product [Didymodactylos carnosus]CAF3664619.1 unnamed protein product [Didymodactylos carnosus]CAF3666151.1 unnamed protein product [Didymodactylos carnosus]
MLTWVLVLALITAFALAFGLGANDVGNTFGTCVGSQVLTLKQAYVLATVSEILGSVLLGGKVTDTIWKGIIDHSTFVGEESQLMIGNLAALAGCCIWLLIATFFHLPVSGTHSIIGATLGFALIERGLRGINWLSFGTISTWNCFMVYCTLVFWTNGCWSLRCNEKIYFGKRTDHLLIAQDQIKSHVWLVCLLTVVAGVLTGIIVWKYAAPSLKNQIAKQSKHGQDIFDLKTLDPDLTVIDYSFKMQRFMEYEENQQERPDEHTSSKMNDSEDAASIGLVQRTYDKETQVFFGPIVERIDVDDELPNESNDLLRFNIAKHEDSPEVAKMFSFLQIFTGIFSSFSHGGNDVSNCVAPLVGIWIIWSTNKISSSVPAPAWLLFYGGLGISVGLFTWGKKTIQTIGSDITSVTPSSGFVIDISSSIAVLIASNLGLPISTTHCKVGAITFVGRLHSRYSVNWKVVRNIIIGWITTVPATGGIAAVLTVLLKLVL